MKNFVKNSLMLGGGLMLGSIAADKISGGKGEVNSMVQAGFGIGAIVIPVMAAKGLMDQTKGLYGKKKLRWL
jgi:hypothetical protein